MTPGINGDRICKICCNYLPLLNIYWRNNYYALFSSCFQSIKRELWFWEKRKYFSELNFLISRVEIEQPSICSNVIKLVENIERTQVKNIIQVENRSHNDKRSNFIAFKSTSNLFFWNLNLCKFITEYFTILKNHFYSYCTFFGCYFLAIFIARVIHYVK